ncbi:hypothetical protein ACFY5K_25895 [Streptomyces griseofuscus]|uniref:hypothetical protein n=1 Tax=Streptomyces griseofuscus TaxID=146922 RepID=UPI00369357E7
MGDFPTHIIEAQQSGWAGPHRLAYGDAHVKRILTGLKGFYDNAGRGPTNPRVYALPGLEDVTEAFVEEKSGDTAPL